MKTKLFQKLVIITMILYVSPLSSQTISGYVTSTRSDIPISGAVVSTSDGNNSSITDEKGYFRVNVKGAEFIIVAGKNIQDFAYEVNSELGLSSHLVVTIRVKIGSDSGMNDPNPGVQIIGVIPEFKPWPPPKPSSSNLLKKEIFKNCSTLSDVNEVLISALDKNGYDDKSYYSVPTSSSNVFGFALGTRLEQIDKNGISKKDPNRWNTNQKKNDLSFSEYLKALLFSNPGHFRVIVFVVTDIGFTSSGSSPERDAAIAWVGGGHNNLPKEISEQVYNSGFNVTALIYEYKLPENSEKAELVSNFTGKQHLKKAKIWDALNQDK